MDQEGKPMKRAGNDQMDGPTKKKAKDDSDDRVAFKLLIPQVAVGAIIGKGGEAMRAMKQEFHCLVSMSKTGETYPGTNERICLIKGTVSNSLCVLRCLNEKIYDKCKDADCERDSFDFPNVNRGTEMKIIMPNTSAGLVIGKAGANIKDIKENCDVNIQVHPKAGSYEAKNSLERVVAVSHDDIEKLMEAAEQVLIKVAADPHHAKEIDRVESEFGTGKMVTPARQANSPNPFFQNTPTSSNMGGGMPGGGMPGGMPGYGYNNAPYQPQQQPPQQMQPRQNFNFNPAAMNNSECMAFLDQLQVVLRESGFNDAAVREIMGALHILAKYNIMALGLGFGVVAMAHIRTGGQQQQQPQMQGGMPNHGAAGFDYGQPTGGQVGNYQPMWFGS